MNAAFARQLPTGGYGIIAVDVEEYYVGELPAVCRETGKPVIYHPDNNALCRRMMQKKLELMGKIYAPLRDALDSFRVDGFNSKQRLLAEPTPANLEDQAVRISTFLAIRDYIDGELALYICDGFADRADNKLNQYLQILTDPPQEDPVSEFIKYIQRGMGIRHRRKPENRVHRGNLEVSEDDVVLTVDNTDNIPTQVTPQTDNLRKAHCNGKV